MVKKINQFLLIASVLLLNFSLSTAQLRDGKLLRSQVWEEFDATKAKADFYVSTKGNDNWSGTLPEPNAAKTDGPFASIERAKEAVRQLKKQVYELKTTPVETRYIGSPHIYGKGKDIVVFIREGFYSLSEPLIFVPEDGGERVETNLPSGAFEYRHLRDNYVTYSAYPGEHPVISGGKLVKNWTKEGDLWTAPFQGSSRMVLITNGKKQMLARTPNDGYFVPRKTSDNASTIYFNKGDLKQWKTMEDNRITMLLRWYTGINSIAKVDEKKLEAYLVKPEDNSNGLLAVPPRYYVENVKELIDSKGEWFYDKHEKKLYYLPMEGVSDPNDAHISASQFNQLIQIAGEEKKPVRNLRFYGLSFEGTTEGASTVGITYAHACELAYSKIRSCEGMGLRIDKGCYQTRIFRNAFENITDGAILLHGATNPTSAEQITRETDITYNSFDKCGGNGCIAAFFALYTNISHNYITRTTGRYPITCGGWANLEEAIDGGYTINYNHLDNVQEYSDDSGAIKVAGMSFNSEVKGNLIHHVVSGFFNDNVAFVFDNMATDWSVTDNIYYELPQGEMKLCAAFVIDNEYKDNFFIESPKNAPEKFIDGKPEFSYSNLQVKAGTTVATGSVIKVKADVTNTGSTGVAPVTLFDNKKPVVVQSFPVIKNNTRTIEFEYRVNEPGKHEIYIGETPSFFLNVEGEVPAVVYEDITINEERLLAGQTLHVSATAMNVRQTSQKVEVKLFVDNKEVKSKTIELKSGESQNVSFDLIPDAGRYPVRIGNSGELMLTVLKSKTLDLKKQKLYTHITERAKPAKVDFSQQKGTYSITAAGTDFFQGEDSYAAVYLKQLKGDFVATVKLSSFGGPTNQWYRSGLFVRNDMSKSFEVLPGSKGSVLMFSTPGRAGIHYDEFGDGSMHKAASENLPEDTHMPLWIRLERHGDSFTGAISLDGKNWIIYRKTGSLPGLTEGMDLGLAAGAPDKKQYTVNFTDWEVIVEDK